MISSSQRTSPDYQQRLTIRYGLQQPEDQPRLPSKTWGGSQDRGRAFTHQEATLKFLPVKTPSCLAHILRRVFRKLSVSCNWPPFHLLKRHSQKLRLVWWLLSRGEPERAVQGLTNLSLHKVGFVMHAQVDIYISHKPTPRTATVSVATYAWTKLYTKVTSCIIFWCL